MPENMNTNPNPSLRRDIGIGGAMMMGLGSIVGTGVFVSIAIAAGIAGSDVIFAIGLAAIVAICNGLSSAQLAANYPVSGGTYEYGYRLLPTSLGFIAGWMFLFAKSASAATAALGLSGYLMATFSHGSSPPSQFGHVASVAIALAALLVLTSLTLFGIKRTNTINIIIVSITLISLTCFVAMGLPSATKNFGENLSEAFSLNLVSPRNQRWPDLLQATALMFVAYTGYGRIATLGEEVKEPHRTIPQAVIATLAVSMLLYFAVAFVAVGAVGADRFAEAAQNQIAALSVVAESFEANWVAYAISVGAITAMLGVLLNLLLGLSRVLLAMARRRDMPERLEKVAQSSGVPVNATIVVATVIGLLILIGDIKLTWSFSAFSVLIYYSITNLCALQLSPKQRIFPIWTAWLGLFACLTLAFWVDRQIWLVGLGVIATGLIWRQFASRMFVTSRSEN